MAETIKKQRCKRCEYEWYPRSQDLPERCPHCKSPYWNKERHRPKEKEEAPAVTALSIARDTALNLLNRLLTEYPRPDDKEFNKIARRDILYWFKSGNMAMLDSWRDNLQHTINELELAKKTQSLPGFDLVKET